VSTGPPAPEDDRPRRRSERARLAILRAANELLHEKGLEQFTIEGVAARAGVGKQTIYRWWPSRAVLVADALLDRDDLVPASPPDTGDVVADISTWAGDLAAALGSARGAATLRMLSAAATESPETSRRLHEKFSGPIQEGATARLAKAADLETTPDDQRTSIDAIIGLIVFRVLANQEVRAPEVADLARSLLSRSPTKCATVEPQ
jgi:AcrR family transcriptional regulator